jgi:signal transduction histidine kinase
MGQAQPTSSSGFWAVPCNVQVQAQLAEKSPLPTALLEADSRRIRYANPAFLRLLCRSAEELHELPFEKLVRAVDMSATLAKVAGDQTVDLQRDLPYVLPDEGTCFGTTIITSVQSTREHALLVQVIDTTEQVRLRERESMAVREALEVNQRLVLAAIREQELADEAHSRTAQVRRLLDEKILLARVSGLLMSSLDPSVTLHQAAEVAVPDFADGALVRVHKSDARRSMIATHVLPRWEATLRQALATADRVSPSLPGLQLKVDLVARGEVLGHIVFARDASRPAFDEADRDLARELGLRIAIAIDNACLHDAAHDAIRSRDDVLSIVSHDLRNPLSSLMMGIQHLTMSLPAEPRPSSLANSLGIMLHSAKHMSRLIDELLELASMHAGQLKLEYSDASLSELVHDALEMMKPQAEQKRVSLRTHEQDAAMRLRCDPERVLRALGNLLGNAIKFSEPGGSVMLAVDQVGDHARFSVSDRAGGIRPEDLSSLFEPYWRGRKTGRKGTGLGLYITRAIVDAHAGKLSVESTLGVGSTFAFVLPLEAP